jgi:hypothetical protein
LAGHAVTVLHDQHIGLFPREERSGETKDRNEEDYSDVHSDSNLHAVSLGPRVPLRNLGYTTPFQMAIQRG